MNKALVVYGGIGYAQGLTETAIALAKEENFLLQSIFLEPEHADEQWNYLFPNDMDMAEKESEPESKERQDRSLQRTNRHLFKESCEAAGVPYETDAAVETSVEDLIRLSAFADLLLIEAGAEVSDGSADDLVEEVHCPVLMVPKTVTKPERTVLLYDGSTASLHVMKLCSYLLPSWSGLAARLITLNESAGDAQYAKPLNGWLESHYKNLERTAARDSGEAERLLREAGENTLLVTASNGTDTLRKLLKNYSGEEEARKANAFLFTAHVEKEEEL